MRLRIKSSECIILAMFGILPILIGGGPALAEVKDTAAEEATCRDIGFSPRTTAFADCVMELMTRKTRITSKSEPVAQTALTPNQQTCVSYGFKRGTNQFGQCLMQLDTAQRQAESQQQQYQLQLAQYQQQVAAYNAQQAEIRRERNRRQGEALMRMSQGMLNSRSPTLLGGLADGFAAVNGTPIPQPVPPMPPSSQNYTIRTPNGDQVYCNYNVAARYMSCR